MDAYITNIINQKLESFLKSNAEQLQTEEDNLRLIVKMRQSNLSLLLYQGSSFVRHIKTEELLD